MTTKAKKNTAMSSNSIDTENSVSTENDNIFDPARLRLTHDFSTALGVKKRLTVIQVRKPGKQEFIRVHPNPDFSIETMALDVKACGQVLGIELNAQDICKELEKMRHQAEIIDKAAIRCSIAPSAASHNLGDTDEQVAFSDSFLKGLLQTYIDH